MNFNRSLTLMLVFVGYITIDWNKLNKKANKIADKAEEAITGEGPSWADKVSNCKLLRFDLKLMSFAFQIKSYVKENSYAATSFAGGFLIGIAYS